VDPANDTDPVSSAYKYGQTVTVADPEKEGYDFTGWTVYKETEAGRRRRRRLCGNG